MSSLKELFLADLL